MLANHRRTGSYRTEFPRTSGAALLKGAIKMALGASFAVAGSAAFAQQAAEPQAALEEVVVTGFRQSLEAALDVKRTSVGAVDAIVAEDIADFPDLNLAESLQRIPGIAIAKDAGEGRTISVRGLGPEFTRVRLNGMEAMSSNGGTDQAGGTNRARQFDFNTFASDLFNEITVRKTASASVEEGSLGATVDLQTARPFDYKDGLTMAGSLTGSYNSLAEELDPRAAFLVSGNFADGLFGALLSIAYTERHLVDEGSSTVRWARPPNPMVLSGTYTGPLTAAQINNSFVPRIPRYDYYEHDQDRLGITSSLQFNPTDRTKLGLDLLYAKFEATRSETFLEIPNFSTASNGITVQDAIIDGSNTMVYGVFNNVDIRSENRYDELSTEFKQATLYGSQELTDSLKLNLLVGMSESDHQNPIQTTLLFDWNNIPQLVYDYRYDRLHPEINYGSTNLSSTVNGTPQTGATSTVNSNGWYLSQVRLRPQTAVNSFENYAIDADWQFADAFSLKGGVQLKKFEFETTELRRSNGTTANLEGTIAAGIAAIPIASYSRQFSFPGSVGIPAWSNRTMTNPDVAAAAGLLGLYDPNTFPMGIEPALANNRVVLEDDTGGFVEFNVDTQLGAMALRGNVGLRYVRTEQESRGYTFLSGSPLLITSRRDYSDTLPSFNVALDVLDNLVLRVGAAKVMSRPALGSLTPGGTVNVSGANRVANLGNPKIDPTRAKNYDISAEWYFAKESLLSLALFRKDVTSRQQQISLNGQVFTGNPFGIPDSVAVAACGAIVGCAPDQPIWTFNTVINGPGGKLKGMEVSYQQPFLFLPSFLSHFGTIINYTGVDADIQYVNAATNSLDTTELVGLSKHSYNFTLYYETESFAARISAAYRSDFLDQVPGRDGNNLEGTEGTTTIDGSVKYSFNEHFEVSLEGLNLTDEYVNQWVDKAANRPLFYHHTGRTFLLGVRMKL